MIYVKNLLVKSMKHQRVRFKVTNATLGALFSKMIPLQIFHVMDNLFSRDVVAALWTFTFWQFYSAKSNLNWMSDFGFFQLWMRIKINETYERYLDSLTRPWTLVGSWNRELRNPLWSGCWLTAIESKRIHASSQYHKYTTQIWYQSP